MYPLIDSIRNRYTGFTHPLSRQTTESSVYMVENISSVYARYANTDLVRNDGKLRDELCPVRKDDKLS